MLIAISMSTAMMSGNAKWTKRMPANELDGVCICIGRDSEMPVDGIAWLERVYCVLWHMCQHMLAGLHGV